MTDTDVRRLEDKVDGALLILARMEGSLSPTIEALKAGQVAASETQLDQERRIRSLERFRYAVPSAAVLSLLITVGTLVYYALVGAH